MDKYPAKAITASTNSELAAIDRLLMTVDNPLWKLSDIQFSDRVLVIPVFYLDEQPLFEWGDWVQRKVVHPRRNARLYVRNVNTYNISGDPDAAEMEGQDISIQHDGDIAIQGRPLQTSKDASTTSISQLLYSAPTATLCLLLNITDIDVSLEVEQGFQDVVNIYWQNGIKSRQDTELGSPGDLL